MIQGGVEEIKKVALFKTCFSFFQYYTYANKNCDKFLPLVGIHGMKFCILHSYLKSKTKQANNKNNKKHQFWGG